MAETGLNVKMGVSGLSKFRQDVRAAKSSMNTLEQALKLTEKEFKATGDKEKYMTDKAQLLNVKLETQKAILAHLNPATVEERLAMTPEQLRPIVHAELTWICVPYVALCLVMLAIWVYFLRHPIVTEMEGGTRQLAPLRTRCMHVGAAILATALPFVLTGILFPNMDKLAWMLCGMIGPLACIAALPAYRASFKELVRTRSMHEATAAVLDDDRREAFAAAWFDFWKHQ